MEQPYRLKTKVCLVGEHGVGKTSLIRRYVLDEFDDRYVVTLGAKVSKREMTFPVGDRGEVTMDMTVWDIMGSKGFRELLREAYFHGVAGVIAACDVTRQESLGDLEEWIEAVHRTVKGVPIVFAANKADLEDRAVFGEAEVRKAAAVHSAPFFFTSAKTGQNVETAFRTLGGVIAEQALPPKA